MMTADQQCSCKAMSRFWQHLEPGDPVGCMRTGMHGIVDRIRGQLVIIDDDGFKFATQLAHIDQPEVPKRS